MAVVDRDSSLIDNITASPVVLENFPKGVYVTTGVVTPAADDSATSVFRFCRVPKFARDIKVEISAADATTAGALNIGLYKTQGDGGAVVDADLFASAFDLSAGPFSNQDVTFESGEYTHAESLEALWDVLGLTAATAQAEYDVCGVVSTTFNGGPTSIKIRVTYTV